MSILKDFSLLGRLHSKINFIYSCKVLRLIPVGFKLKWSEQTGFEDPNLIKKVRDTLQLTSLNLLDTVLTASQEKFRLLLGHLKSVHSTLPPNDWSKGLKNYNFLFKISTSKHLKSSKASTRILSFFAASHLLICFPSPP